ncbi:HEAT repeat domain-containing protein [Actinoplanes sp. CA-051413]|uniref:HEAT repeat domain-containing protein n=1 Tax=Actinoplanes sp. CA-051413 TaxID=3239899 RepID=UPI003D975F35
MTDALTAALETPAYDDEAVLRLVELLVEADSRDDELAARTALSRLGGRPRLLVRLDERIRRITWRYADESAPAFDMLLRRFAKGRRTPIALAAAALHRDGRVRERAVVAIAARPLPELVALLVLRADDWVPQVRNPARAALTRLLSDDPGRFLPGAVPMAVKLADRFRGHFARELVTAAVLAAPDDVRRQLAASPDRDQRRLAFDADLHQGRLDLAALADLAVREGDAQIRNRAAQVAYEQAVGRQHRPTLERLFAARPAGVRALGLTGLLRLGPAAEAVPALDDPAPLVRAIARDAARRAGTDAVAHYRTTEPSPGAVAGLAEAGSDRDAPVLVALLSHPSGRIRAAAVRALGHLGAVPVELVVPLLRDPAAAVVREAALALRPFDRRVPPGLGWELLGDSRPEVRRAGYRLLNGRDPVTRRQAALRLADDPDPRLATRGRADATR